MPRAEPEVEAEELYLQDMGLPADVVAHARVLRDNMSGFETKFWKFIGGKHNRYGLLRQIPMGGFFLDFFSPGAMVVIETDGPQHLMQTEHDSKRDKILASKGIKTMRLSPADFKRTQPLELLQIISGFIEGDSQI